MKTPKKQQNLKLLVSKIIIVIMLVAIIISQAGCIKKKDPTPLWDEGFYLDTVCRITLYATDDELKMSAAKPILNEAFDLIRRYESILSRTKEGSDIWKINNAKGEPIACDSITIDLLSKAIRFGKLSDGAFDVTIGTVKDLWNFNDAVAAPKVPTTAELSRALRHVDYTAIEISGNTVTLLDKDAQLDLGGIAKGYIADKVGQFLRTKGVTGAVVDLGGNLEIVGYKAGWVPLASEVEEKGDVDGDGKEEVVGGIAGGTPFVVGIKKPYTETGEIVMTLTTSNSSIVTSGVYERYFEDNGKKYHHILSSKTGFPVNNDLISATIVGPANTSADCDAMSTICMIYGKEKALEFMKEFPDYGVILIDSENEITTAGRLPEYTIIDGSTSEELTEEGIKVN